MRNFSTQRRMGIQAREGGFVPEVKRLTARGAGPLTAYPNQSPAPKETAPVPQRGVPTLGVKSARLKQIINPGIVPRQPSLGWNQLRCCGE